METELSYMVAFPTEQVNNFFAQDAFMRLPYHTVTNRTF